MGVESSCPDHCLLPQYQQESADAQQAEHHSNPCNPQAYAEAYTCLANLTHYFREFSGEHPLEGWEIQDEVAHWNGWRQVESQTAEGESGVAPFVYEVTPETLYYASLLRVYAAKERPDSQELDNQYADLHTIITQLYHHDQQLQAMDAHPTPSNTPEPLPSTPTHVHTLMPPAAGWYDPELHTEFLFYGNGETKPHFSFLTVDPAQPAVPAPEIEHQCHVLPTESLATAVYAECVKREEIVGTLYDLTTGAALLQQWDPFGVVDR